MAQQQKKVEGVAIDGDARRPDGDGPVTVVVAPSGTEYEADNWTVANNWLSAGGSIKQGYPTGPVMTLNEDAPDAPGREQQESTSSRAPSPTPPRPTQPSTTAAAPASS